MYRSVKLKLESYLVEYLNDAILGDEIAFQFLHYYYFPIIIKYLQNKWRNISEIDAEIVGEKALKSVWDSLSNYNTEMPFKPWLFTIVQRTANHYFRNKTKPHSLKKQDENTIIDKSILGPEEIYYQKEISSIIKRVLSQLNGKRRDILILKYIFNFDYNEIVQTLSLPSIWAARQLCYNALRECREILDKTRLGVLRKRSNSNN